MYSFTKCKLLSLLLLAGFAFQSQAAVISFDPSAQSVGLGDVATVDLRISGLGDEILTGFDMDISFDDSILAFSDFAFGTGLDTFGFGTINDVFDYGDGTVNVFELSFDFDDDLRDFQPNDFILGTFTFDTLAMGTSALNVTYALLSGEFIYDDLLGFDIVSEVQADLQSGSITVPEPGIMLLLITGLLGFGIQKRFNTSRA